MIKPIILVAAFLGGIAIGAPAANWKAASDFALERDALRIRQSELSRHADELEKAIAEQNHAGALVAERLKAAQAGQQQAERLAADLAALSKGRLAKLEQITANSCAEVLKGYWELRR